MEKAHCDNLIDLKQRTSELRVKSIHSNSVSHDEALRAAVLGLIHLKGDGVACDPKKGARYLATAVKGGVAQAKHELALLHIKGEDVAYDAQYAIELLKSASAEGYVASTISLAELYIFGKHCTRNTEEAMELLFSVVYQDEPAAMYYIAYVYDCDPQHKNPFEAAYWYRRAAEHGHFKSQIRLASLYATGCGVPICRETAKAFLEVALESTSQQDPRFLLWQGERLMAQHETEFMAQALIKAAADMQHTPAQRVLLKSGWRA